MALIKLSRMISRYSVTKSQVRTSLGLDPVIDWTTDGRYLIAEHAETSGTAIPPFTRTDRNFTLVLLSSIYDTLGIPEEFHNSISVGFTETDIVFFIRKEL